MVASSSFFPAISCHLAASSRLRQLVPPPPETSGGPLQASFASPRPLCVLCLPSLAFPPPSSSCFPCQRAAWHPWLPVPFAQHGVVPARVSAFPRSLAASACALPLPPFLPFLLQTASPPGLFWLLLRLAAASIPPPLFSSQLPASSLPPLWLWF